MASEFVFINQNGRVACGSHGGGYLKSYLESHPQTSSVKTPLDQWERVKVSEAEAAGFLVACEEC